MSQGTLRKSVPLTWISGCASITPVPIIIISHAHPPSLCSKCSLPDFPEWVSFSVNQQYILQSAQRLTRRIVYLSLFFFFSQTFVTTALFKLVYTLHFVESIGKQSKRKHLQHKSSNRNLQVQLQITTLPT